MATYFGDHFKDLATDVTSFEGGYRAAGPIMTPGKSLSLVKGSVQIDGTANGDILKIIRDVPASARIWSIKATFNIGGGNTTAGTADVGLYPSEFDHSSTDDTDDNLFESAQSLTSGLSEADAFTGASLTALDRGKRVWELLGLSSDPGVNYDICVTTDTGIALSSGTEIFQLEVQFLND